MHALLRALLAAAPLALGACAPPEIIKPYRIEIQQGNYVSQEMVAQLRLGMSREQVRFLLGTPLVSDIFHANRWDYVYYRELPYGKREQRRLSVHFEDNKLVRLGGDIVAVDPAIPSGTSPAPAAKPAAPAEGEQKPPAKPE
jgi:outer membrane protein assembly factor BamE